MKEGILIYGCYGYTGRLISELAAAQKVQVILAGRDAAKVKELAQSLNLPFRVFDLKNESDVTEGIKDVKVVLHCAGPFRYTAKQMAAACLKTKTHYLDITGEYDVFEDMFKLDKAAKDAGILLMPGVGFDVVPTDCLSLYLKDKVPNVDTLELALMMKGGSISHGTAITVAENLGEDCVVRRNGELEKVPNGELLKQIKFNDSKKRNAVAIAWGDISTAFRTTGIPNITVYNCLPDKVISSMKMSNRIGFLLRSRLVKNFLIRRIKSRPAGPDAER
ncbi:MAG TPA: saccharopine dehydrogenase NADP-binding domain-containing protein, partial [Chitinophagales bacterium]|nr:saccharopine dehydrogenase NADP-binding domain-containing protein [Chitinophagales bacterium]